MGISVIGNIEYSGSIGPSSDKRLKENIRELETKKAVELIKYIVPKTYKYIDKEKYGDKSCVGMIANDFLTDKMPSEWDNIIIKGKDGYLRFDYSMCVPILWSALQHSLKENEEMKRSISYLKGEVTKLKNKDK